MLWFFHRSYWIRMITNLFCNFFYYFSFYNILFQRIFYVLVYDSRTLVGNNFVSNSYNLHNIINCNLRAKKNIWQNMEICHMGLDCYVILYIIITCVYVYNKIQFGTEFKKKQYTHSWICCLCLHWYNRRWFLDCAYQL